MKSLPIEQSASVV